MSEGKAEFEMKPLHTISGAQLEQLRAEHPDAVVLTAPSGDQVAVTPPRRPVWKRFRAKMNDARTRNDAPEMLLRDCTLVPDAERLGELLEQRPALAELFSGGLFDLAGGSREDVEKKAL